MIIQDIRKEFFEALKGRILIMCVLDVDAICSCKILQCLLEAYSSRYTVVPVESMDGLCKSFEEYRNSIDTLVMLNFGNSINIPKLLNPPENLTFFILDSHRPINVYNFYKNPQVKLYFNHREDTELNIPPKSMIFRKDSSAIGNEEDDEEDIALLNADARELTNEQLERRRELRDWLVQKRKLMFDYEEFHYFIRSISIILYELSCFLAKNNNYLLWLGILGLTSQLRSDRITQDEFDNESRRVVRHIARNQVSTHHSRGNSWSIQWKEDLNLDLYREWTVFDSFSYTPLTVCKFQLWNDKGLRNLSEFLVECGLKLCQVKQRFMGMDRDEKAQLRDAVPKVCLGDLQYKYNVQELVGRTFILRFGCKDKIVLSACDAVLGIRALLETHDSKLSGTERFVRAIQSLSVDNASMRFTIMESGFELASSQLVQMFNQVKTIIATRKVVDDGVFFHVDLEHSNNCQDFARGISLISFAKYLLNAYVSSQTTRVARRSVRLPLILMCPDFEDPEQTYIVGIPPVAQESKKNFFGKAFEQAALNIECEIRPDLSETNLIRTNVHNKDPLLGQMRLLLE